MTHPTSAQLRDAAVAAHRVGKYDEALKAYVPYLRAVPGDAGIWSNLGALFRSRSFQRNETELVIIATPHLVKPLDMQQQTLPTDFYKEPNDAEFYVLGLMEGESKGSSTGIQGHLDGEFGHAVPKQQ